MNDTDNGVDMADRRELADRVDTDLKRAEQETGIDWFNPDDRFTLTTYSVTVVRSVLKHDEARLNWVYVTDSTELSGRVDNVAAVVDSDAMVEGIQATLPIGCLSIKGVARENDRDSKVVSTPEKGREPFTDGGVVEGGDIEVGAVVEDRDNVAQNDRMVVINTPPVTASDWETNNLGVTVADENRDYDKHDAIAVCAFADDLEDARPGYDGSHPLKLAEVAVYTKAYPAGRLRRVGVVEQ